MSNRDKEWLLRSTVLAGAMAALLGAPTFAQESDEPVSTDAEEEESAPTQDTIVVTGSRIRRDEFSSTSPLQVVDSATISESGLLDVGEILRSTTVVQGVQLDQQFNSLFVSDAGPGGQAVGLRGLGPERTLNLINGRRMAPAGVEGAPSFPDISLVPSSMIERVDILLDGASSVYGSDAVGGVINFILRDRFEGFELEAQYNAPQESGRESSQVNFVFGGGGDNAWFTFAAEHTQSEELRGDERDWMCVPVVGFTDGGTNDIYPDFDGQVRCGERDILIDDKGTADTSDDEVLTVLGVGQQNQSFYAFPYGQILLGRDGAPGAFGLFPNTIAANLATNFNGLYGLTVPLEEDIMMLPSEERTNVYFTGEYDLNAFVPGMNAFFEAGLSNRQTFFEFGQDVIDAVVKADNPYIARDWPDAFALLGAPTSNFTSRPLQPWRDTLDVELTQYRMFTGVTGDLGFVNLPDWSYEAFAGYTRSQGYSERTVIREEALTNSLNLVVNPATGEIECAAQENPNAPFSPGETLEPCVPFNPLFGGLYPSEGNTPQFENPLLEGYLRGIRSSTTFVDERIAGGFVTGPLYALPAGDLQAVIGVEWRESSIDTRSDDVTARGLGSGFFLDRPTRGNVELFEVYGELSIPIVQGVQFAENVEVNLAGRYVDHQFYGSNEVYSANARWEPFDWLTFRGTYGTSFRAPNLRELFLEGQSGFAAVTDPCEVPTLATSDTDGDGTLDAYTPGPDDDGDGVGDLDGRAPEVLQNCQTEGLDPFSLAIGINTGSVETFSAGNTGLDPEESTAWTAGFVFEQPWFDIIDVRLGLNFFEYKIENSVFEPSANFLVSSCYTSQTFPDDPFCTRRLRDPNTGFLLEIDATPFNIAEEVSRGYDVNLALAGDFELFGRSWDATSDIVATFTDEVSQTIILPGAEPDFDDDAAEFGNPYWRAQANQRLMTGDFTFFWQVRYISEQGLRERDDDGGIVGVPSNCDGTNADGDFIPSCFKVDPVFYHDVSLTWSRDTWEIRGGVRNLLDQDPPTVDEDLSSVEMSQNQRNVPIGVGYDQIGRTFFINVSKAF